VLAACAVSPPAPERGPPFLYALGETGSFLFGTIHVPDPRVLELPPSVESALLGSRTLVTEVPLSPEGMAAVVAAAGVSADTPPLRERLPPELYARLATYLGAHGVSIESVEHQPVWMVNATLAMSEYLPELRAGRLPLDVELAVRAQRAGLALAGLEAPGEQFGAFETVSEASQIRQLSVTLDLLEEVSRGGRSPVTELVDAYLTGDEDRLLAQLEGAIDRNDPESVALYEKLLNDRSRVMAERIAKRLESDPGRPQFFALGAGHLPGPDGILELLRARGLSVRRVD
jgi:uncharacterized protein YbaP (TraB family)